MQDKYLSRTYTVTATLALYVLVVAGWAWSTTNLIAPIHVMLLMPLLWVLWIICAALDEKHNLWRPLLLWLLIDMAAMTIYGCWDYLPKKPGPDSSLVDIFIFFPVMLPAMFAISLPVIGDVIANIGDGAIHLLPSRLQHSHISEWVAFSILSALSCAASICLFRSCNLILEL